MVNADRFVAIIEDSIFAYEVISSIDDEGNGANPYEVRFNDEPLTHNQTIHFIDTYGYADLSDEIMTQYLDALLNDC